MFFTSEIIFNGFVNDADTLDELVDLLISGQLEDGVSNYRVIVIKQTPKEVAGE